MKARTFSKSTTVSLSHGPTITSEWAEVSSESLGEIERLVSDGIVEMDEARPRPSAPEPRIEEPPRDTKKKKG